MADEVQTQIDWRCNFCGQEEGVENGVCPKCGPSQTTPISEAAKQEAGVYEAEAERAKQAEAAGAKEVTATER